MARTTPISVKLRALLRHPTNAKKRRKFRRNADVPSSGTETPTLGEIAGFHLTKQMDFRISDDLSLQPSINVLLPSLNPEHMSGGPNTALLVAAMLAERGERIRLICTDAAFRGERDKLLTHMDGLLRRPVARERIEALDGFDRRQAVSIGADDIFFATAWWTAQIAKVAVAQTAHKKFIYLIQDFEPILHDASTFQARALETYGLPHIPLINTRLLLDHLVEERAGLFADHAFAADALCFEPALDREQYFPENQEKAPSEKRTLLFYARPTAARRNLFEIGVAALRDAVASGGWARR